MRIKKTLALTLVAVCAGLTLSTVSVDASQKSKNTWRNLAIGAGALTGIGLLNHNGTEALIGAAGTAYSAHRYEQDRHNQSQRARYHRRHHHHIF